jgi:hydroxymethylpyrimidine/phosphomethylpyrimidine kinase
MQREDGMLGDFRHCGEEVAGAVARLGLKNVVLDPVLAATSGAPLLDAGGLARPPLASSAAPPQ